MGLLKSFLYGGEAADGVEPSFSEYPEVFGKQPALISCDMNFIKMLPSNSLDCCVKLQMDIFIKANSESLITEAEASHIANVRSILSEHIAGRFVGQGIISATESVFLMFYIPQKQAQTCKKMLTETFMGSFRHVETNIIYDPEGLQYKKYLYPSVLQMKRIENTRMLRSLKGYGDNGSMPRAVKFNLVFQNKNVALAFYSESMAKGFVYKDLVSEPPPEGMVLPRFRLVLEKTIPFNLELLMRIDDYLLNLSKKYDAEYRSIETDIIEEK